LSPNGISLSQNKDKGTRVKKPAESAG